MTSAVQRARVVEVLRATPRGARSGSRRRLRRDLRDPRTQRRRQVDDDRDSRRPPASATPGRCASSAKIRELRAGAGAPGSASCCRKPATSGCSRCSRPCGCSPSATARLGVPRSCSNWSGSPRVPVRGSGRCPADSAAGSTSPSASSPCPNCCSWTNRPPASIPRRRRQFWDLIRVLADDGTTILLTTHYLEEAAALADRVAVIADGRGGGGGFADTVDRTRETRPRRCGGWRETRSTSEETDHPTELIRQRSSTARNWHSSPSPGPHSKTPICT